MQTILRRKTKTGDIEIARRAKRVSVKGIPVDLDRKEYGLIALLMKTPDQVVSYSDVAKALFKASELATSRTIEAIADKARDTLKAAGAGPGHLAMIWGQGLQLYSPPATVKARTFHVPSAHFECSGNGRTSPPPDMVEPTWEGEVVERIDDQRICDVIFDALNRDNRPNRHIAGALSTGDIITLRVDTDTPSSYQVASVGFMPLANPVLGLDEEVEALIDKLDDNELAF